MLFRVFALLLFIGCLAFQIQAQPVVVYENVVGEISIPVHKRGDVVEYIHDDGAANINMGPPSTFDPDMLWGNYFFTEEGGEVIIEISAAFGPTWPSLPDNPPTFWILDDPDMDMDPRNAMALMSIQATPDVSGNNFFTVEIPPTHVSGAFFVGVSAKLLGGQDAPARVDTDGPAEMAWFFYAPEIKDVINDLASAPFGTQMSNPEFVPFPGVFMIRAAGIAATGCTITPATFAFDTVIIGTSTTLEGSINNPGDEACEIAGATIDDDDFSVSIEPGVVLPGNSLPFEVTFTPTGTDLISSTLTVSSPDGDLTASVSGRGVNPPITTISTDTVDMLVTNIDPTDTATLTISNIAAKGSADLTFSIFFHEVILDDPPMTDGDNELLSIDPLSGTIAAGEDFVITLTAEYNQGAYSPGIYSFEVIISTNAPETPFLSAFVFVTVDTVSSEDDPSPAKLALLPNYPNPFRDETTIRFEVPQTEHVTIEIFDLSGRLVTTLADQPFETGSHSVIWNTQELAGGVYICRMTAGGFVQSLRVTVVG